MMGICQGDPFVQSYTIFSIYFDCSNKDITEQRKRIEMEMRHREAEAANAAQTTISVSLSTIPPFSIIHLNLMMLFEFFPNAY